MADEQFVGRAAYGLTVGALGLLLGTAGLLAIPAVRERLTTRPASYAAQQHIDVPASLYESARATVVLFGRGSCAACQRAKPVLADLAQRLSELGVPLRLAVNGEDPTGDAAYATSLGLTDQQIVTVNTASLRLHVVPTIVLVDRQGLIRYAHEGAPTADDATALLAMVTMILLEP